MGHHNRTIVTNKAYLWIYSNKTKELKKYTDVEIAIRCNVPAGRPFVGCDVTRAFKAPEINRVVSNTPYKVNYYPKFQEFLVWSYKNEDKKIRQLISEAIIEKSLDTLEQSIKKLQISLELFNHASSLIA